jgi:nucleotide-binding universal stress UspA family protein
MDEQAEEPAPVKVIVDEKDSSKDTGVSSASDTLPDSAITRTAAAATTSSSLSPPTSPPASPPATDSRQSPSVQDYYASRPKHDKLGNPIPDRRRPSAMSSVYGTSHVRLPGDLGSKDPRRPKSPAPAKLPGDLGANDPRRPRSTNRSANSSPHPGHVRHPSDASPAPREGERILKDPKRPPTPKGEDGRDSDDDADADNDNDTDAEDSKRGRGRVRPEPGRTTSGKAINVRDESEDSEHDTKKPDPTKGESKLSFSAEGKKTPGSSEKKRVHPMSAFDMAPLGMATPMSSDDETHSELRAAQKLSLTMSAVHSTPSAHRVIRQIIRGDYAHFQREAEEGRRRQRMYLVATDASPEAEHALEWTIGTVLRDGDTLFAVYAADEDDTAGNEGGVEIGKGADMVKDTADIVRGLASLNVPQPASPGPSPLSRAGQLAPAAQVARSGSRGVYGAAEAERRRTLEDITARCVRMLRKTRLQCRVVVEVFHCKSPRHMITEVIDFLSPTLVIIGSRGQSAVKGVLLGSFSNYLVTKSSVPVMVARKKLRKHSKSQRNRDGTLVPYSGSSGRPGRFSNMIEVPKGKGLRVKGWDQVGID